LLQELPLGFGGTTKMNRTALAIAMQVCLLVVTTSAIIFDSGPLPLSYDAPSNAFSAARAYKIVQAIGQGPHSIGSPEHAIVRDYLLQKLRDLGLDPEIQRDTVVDSGEQTAAIVENLHAVIRGQHSSRSILMVAHYDTVPTSPGAADDSSGVAAILETARALKAGSSLRNDIEILLTDGEEVGLLGARLFAAKRAGSSNADIVLNFEARGHTGPAIMFETAGDKDLLIRGLVHAVPSANATSVSSEVYKRMPNDTDFTVFKNAGFQGLNFAFIAGLSHYHTVLDSPSTLNLGSLQQQGSYALGLASYFGERDRSLDGSKSKTSPTYFTLLGSHLIVVSAVVQGIVNCLAVVSLVLAIVVANRNTWATPTGTLIGFLLVPIYGVAAVLTTALIWKAICAARPEYRTLNPQFIYEADLYLVASALIVVAVGFVLYGMVSEAFRDLSLAIGGLVWWGIATVAAAWYAPGAAYLFALPLLTSAIALLLLSFQKRAGEAWILAMLSAAAVPALLVYVPVLHQTAAALTISALPVLTICEVVCAIALLPQFALARKATGKAALTYFSLAMIAVVVGLTMASRNSGGARPSHVVYTIDASARRAVWVSLDDHPDGWSSQFFKRRISGTLIETWFPMWPPRLMVGEAPLLELRPPVVTTESDTKTTNGRLVSIRIKPIRRVAFIYIKIIEGGAITGSWIGESRFTSTAASGKPWHLFFYAIPEDGLVLTLEMERTEPVHAIVYDCSYGLPDFSGLPYAPRPSEAVPAPLSISDATVVGTSIAF